MTFPVSFYEKLLDSLHDGIWVSDTQDQIYFTNKATEALLGKSADVFLHSKVNEHLFSFDDPSFYKAFCSVKKELKAYEFNSRSNDPSGNIHYLNGWLYPQIIDKEYAGMICTFRDITERHIAKKALKKSEEMYRLIADNVSDVIWTIDYESKHFTYVSPSVYKMLGYTPEEILNHTIEDILIPEDLVHFNTILNTPKETLLSAYDLSQIHYLEVRQSCKDGHIIWVEIAASIILNKNGEPKEFIGTTRNISDRKEAEQALRESEENYKILSEETPVAMIISEQGICIEANAAASRMFGYNRDELIGISASDIIAKESIDLVTSNMSKGNAEPYEATATRKDGTKFPAIFQGKVFRYKGRIARLSLCTDQSDFIKREEEMRDAHLRLSLAVKAAQIGIFDWDSETDILQWDNRMFDIYQVKPHQSTAYKTWSEKVHSEDQERVNQELDLAIETGADFNSEFRIIRPNGEIRYLRSHAIVLKSDKGNSTRMIGVNYDVTNQHRIEEDLRYAKDKAEESDRLKSAFLSNMSHEIRTPMNSILGFSELLLNSEYANREQLENYLKIINNSGNQLLDIVNDILDISKIEAGQALLNLQDVNLSSLCYDIFSSFKVAMTEKGINWDIKIDKHVKDVLYRCDEVKTKQIITNLISNAIKFTHDGYVKLSITIENEKLLFCISDSGIGIAPSQHDKIFERFRQVETDGAREYGGTGLGLSICKSLIRLMNGEIWVESELGVGSSFFFTLPTQMSLN